MTQPKQTGAQERRFPARKEPLQGRLVACLVGGWTPAQSVGGGRRHPSDKQGGGALGPSLLFLFFFCTFLLDVFVLETGSRFALLEKINEVVAAVVVTGAVVVVNNLFQERKETPRIEVGWLDQSWGKGGKRTAKWRGVELKWQGTK